MKKATLIVWVIIFGFIALVIFQNQTFFLAKETFRINLGVMTEYLSPAIPNAVVVLVFFFAGLLIAYLFGFSARFKAKLMIKRLNATIAASTTELSQLKSEINKLKGIEEPVEGQADTVKLDMNTTQKIAAGSPADEKADQKIAADSPADENADKTIKYDTAEESGNREEDKPATPAEKNA